MAMGWALLPTCMYSSYSYYFADNGYSWHSKYDSYSRLLRNWLWLWIGIMYSFTGDPTTEKNVFNISLLKALAELKIELKVSSFQVSVLLIILRMCTNYVLVKRRTYKSYIRPMVSVDYFRRSGLAATLERCRFMLNAGNLLYGFTCQGFRVYVYICMHQRTKIFSCHKIHPVYLLQASGPMIKNETQMLREERFILQFAVWVRMIINFCVSL